MWFIQKTWSQHFNCSLKLFYIGKDLQPLLRRRECELNSMREDERVKLQLQQRQQTARDAFAVIASSGQGSAARVSKVFHLSEAISWAWLFSFYSLSVRHACIPPSTKTWTLQSSPDACVRPPYAVGDKTVDPVRIPFSSSHRILHARRPNIETMNSLFRRRIIRMS